MIFFFVCFFARVKVSNLWVNLTLAIVRLWLATPLTLHLPQPCWYSVEPCSCTCDMFYTTLHYTRNSSRVTFWTLAKCSVYVFSASGNRSQRRHTHFLTYRLESLLPVHLPCFCFHILNQKFDSNIPGKYGLPRSLMSRTVSLLPSLSQCSYRALLKRHLLIRLVDLN